MPNISTTLHIFIHTSKISKKNIVLISFNVIQMFATGIVCRTECRYWSKLWWFDVFTGSTSVSISSLLSGRAWWDADDVQWRCWFCVWAAVILTCCLFFESFIHYLESMLIILHFLQCYFSTAYKWHCDNYSVSKNSGPHVIISNNSNKSGPILITLGRENRRWMVSLQVYNWFLRLIKQGTSLGCFYSKISNHL